MRFRLACTFLFLFTFMVELVLDPSTNFVRAPSRSSAFVGASVRSSPVAKEFLKLFHDESDAMSDADATQGSGGGDSLQDASVCYAVVAQGFQFDVEPPGGDLNGEPLQTQIGNFASTIFQPPKHA